jgi:hypothetical protein
LISLQDGITESSWGIAQSVIGSRCDRKSSHLFFILITLSYLEFVPDSGFIPGGTQGQGSALSLGSCLLRLSDNHIR